MGRRATEGPTGTRYYSVVPSATRPGYLAAIGACWVVAATVALAQTSPVTTAPPAVPLLPAETAWLVTLDRLPSAGGALDESRVYVPLQDGGIVAIDRRNGRRVWHRDAHTVVPLTVANGRLYVATGDALLAIDPATGDMRWQVSLPTVAAGPALASGDLVLVPVASGAVVAIDPADGTPRWDQPAGAAGRTFLARAGDQVYASASSRLMALAIADGRRAWTLTLPGTLGPPAPGPGRVFVGSTDNYLSALSPAGRLLWRWRTGGDVVGAVVDDARVYTVARDNIVRALDRRTGNQRWMRQIGTRPMQPPLLAGEEVLITGVAPALSTFSTRTGAPIGTFTLPGETAQGYLQGPPLVDAGAAPFQVAIVVITQDGRVIGLRPAGLAFREAAPQPFTALPGRMLSADAVP